MAIKTILHSFKIGDLISFLPGLQHIHIESGDKFHIYQRLDLRTVHAIDSSDVCMTRESFEFVKPLIESQDYIEKFEIWEGQEVDIDFDKTRDSRIIPMPAGDIYFWAYIVCPDLQTDLSYPWLHVREKEDWFFDDKIIVNRTPRYTNPFISYFFLKNYQDKIIFSGTEKEHEEFCKSFNLELTLLKADNYLEIARIMKACKFLLSNQSSHFHVANGMKTPRLLELSPAYPNTFPQGQNGYVFMYQSTLELQFKKMIEW